MSIETVAVLAEVPKGRDLVRVTHNRSGYGDFADVRVHYERDGEWHPTRKGIALTTAVLDDVIDALITFQNDTGIKEKDS